LRRQALDLLPRQDFLEERQVLQGDDGRQVRAIAAHDDRATLSSNSAQPA
jgi:hypothetical protein